MSDDQIEYQVRDRLSFTRFLGLGFEASIPDGTTLWLFREKLAKAGLIDKLFERFGQHLEAKGYIARGGQMVDATIVPAAQQPGRERAGQGRHDAQGLEEKACKDSAEGQGRGQHVEQRVRRQCLSPGRDGAEAEGPGVQEPYPQARTPQSSAERCGDRGELQEEQVRRDNQDESASHLDCR